MYIVLTILSIFVIVILIIILRNIEKNIKLANWLMFGVLLALVPIIFDYLITYMSTGSNEISIFLSKGELFIVSVAISANACGSYIASKTDSYGLKPLITGSSIILIIISSLLFAAISTAYGQSYDPVKIQFISVLMFLLNLGASAGCILLGDK